MIARVGNEFRVSCGKCRGTGEYVSHNSMSSGSCWTCGGRGFVMKTEAEIQKAQRAAERRKEKHAAEYAARDAQWAQERQERQANPDPRIAALRAVLPSLSGRDQEFAQSLVDGYLKFGSLSAKQWPWVEKLADRTRQEKRAEQAAQNAASQHVGAIKQRLDLTATVEFVREMASDFGTSYLTKLRDGQGNVLAWFARERFEVGRVLQLRGTVTKHTEYRGVKETTINRVKLAESTEKVAA